MEKTSIKHFLVLIFGASGSGKTTLLRELRKASDQISIHQKVTDRSPKRYDSEEIRCIEQINNSEYQYIYQQYGYRYGIEKEQIDQALSQAKDHFVICNDIDTIKRIKVDYGDSVRTVFLLFDAPREHIEKVQKARGITDDQVDLRIAKIGVLSELFLDNADLFDGVILNRMGSPFGNMVHQVESILDRRYTSPKNLVPTMDKRVVAEMLDVIEVIRQNLCNLAIDVHRKVRTDYVFILMAMIEGDPLLDDTHNAIKRAASSCGLRAERVDDIAFTEQITDKVLGSIRCAQFVVADITHERPNVYYEIGYAHAFKKPTILTARKGESPHFDIQGFPIIYYDSATKLESELVRFFGSYEWPE